MLGLRQATCGDGVNLSFAAALTSVRKGVRAWIRLWEFRSMSWLPGTTHTELGSHSPFSQTDFSQLVAVTYSSDAAFERNIPSDQDPVNSAVLQDETAEVSEKFGSLITVRIPPVAITSEMYVR